MGKVAGREISDEEPKGDSKSSRKDVRAYFRKVLDIDVIKVFEMVKGFAEVPADKIRDRMTLNQMINEATKNAWRANLVALKARTERELFRMEKDAAMIKLNMEASEILTKEQEERGIKKKQITVDMVKQQMSGMEDYRDLIRREQDVREMKDACQSLATQWSERKGLLQTQARLVTSELELKMPGMDRQDVD